MSNTIELGDIVALKSDASVIMTVGKFSDGDNKEAICYYFLNGEIKTFTIRVEALTQLKSES